MMNTSWNSTSCVRCPTLQLEPQQLGFTGSSLAEALACTGTSLQPTQEARWVRTLAVAQPCCHHGQYLESVYLMAKYVVSKASAKYAHVIAAPQSVKYMNEWLHVRQLV